MQHANLTLQTPNKRKLFPINVNQPVYIQYQVHPFETGAQHHLRFYRPEHLCSKQQKRKKIMILERDDLVSRGLFVI